jgi:hypothetical protein
MVDDVRSDTHIGEVERLQSETGEGPCVTARTTGAPVIIDDLSDTTASPRFTPRALRAGMRAVYSVPMKVGDVRFGALNLYRTTPGDLDARAATVAQLVGDLATSYLSVDAADRASRLADQLQHALDSRVVIEQAKGRLSLAWNQDVTSAFERLRRHARNRHRRSTTSRPTSSPAVSPPTTSTHSHPRTGPRHDPTTTSSPPAPDADRRGHPPRSTGFDMTAHDDALPAAAHRAAARPGAWHGIH